VLIFLSSLSKNWKSQTNCTR